jgi:hypothetical protein
VPDIVVRHIEDAVAERVKMLARERQWSINDVILHALRHGLGLAGDPFAERECEFHNIASLTGTWAADESAVFKEAIEALADAPCEPMLAGHKE